ncbi:mediator of RNA polymerase II transcription subunit 15a-like isoform X3 [Vitis riparia]|uniref:mediator of RNA polymerase II transcription subunit 15a-like isoform X3 n=1 Tax=Vitis riparia TaxID=96939 RepID=UPI00155AA074|nr:mediator of RNA polymerase II transcription subunit 15a-like isoform X3 [Vitis riparia]
MDTNNWRPAQAEPAMDLGDWRTQLPPDSRQRIVNKIMDTLKRHLPVSGQEGLHELRTLAVRLEENAYTAAMSQSDYLRKISLKMLAMETESQTAMPSNLPSNFASNSENPPDPGQGNALTSLQHVAVGALQQNPVSAPQQANNNNLSSQNGVNVLQQNINQFQRLNLEMDTLKRDLPVSGQEGLHELRTMAVRFEENTYTAATSQSDYLRKISLEMPAMVKTAMPSNLPSNFASNSENPPDPASLDSTAQTGTTNVGDWQEEVYQKHDSLPQQPKTEQLEKLKFKAMSERMIAVLQFSKNSITPNFKEKLSGYEKQIVDFINTHRPRKPVPPLQHGQLPLSHMHSMQQPQQSQSQLTQGQPHENQMNPQLQPMNLQGSVATMQQNNAP